MKVSVITPTKDRPEAAELCRRWFRDQTYPVHEHLIIEGGGMLDNLREGMEQATGDVILFADDDDYYSPRWVRWVASQYRRPDIQAAGQRTQNLYHIRSGRVRIGLQGPLAGQLSFRACQRDAVLECMDEDERPKRILRKVKSVVTEHQFCTRILGLYPTGMSVKHDPAKYPKEDPERSMLRKVVGGKVVDAYLDAMERIDAQVTP